MRGSRCRGISRWSPHSAMPEHCGRAPRSRSMSIRPRQSCLKGVFARHQKPPRSRERHMAPEPLAGSIETATWGHAGLMAEIHRTAFPATEAWSRDVMLLQLGMPATFGLVYSHAGMILGRVAADEAEILTLAVDPGQRRRGVGSALLSTAMARAGSLGATFI